MRVPKRMSLAADIFLFILDRGVVQDCKKEGSYKIIRPQNDCKKNSDQISELITVENGYCDYQIMTFIPVENGYCDYFASFPG